MTAPLDLSLAGFRRLAAERLVADPAEAGEDPRIQPLRGDHDLNETFPGFGEPGFPLKPAAVLVPVIERVGALWVVMTQRPDHMSSHAGQVAFPGGKIDAADPSPLAAALREAEEEIGLAPGGVELVGALQPVPTIATNYAVYPFVGLIEPGQTWRPAEAEVEQVLEFSLAQLQEGYGRRRILRRGVPFRTDTYVVDDHLVWGATARMLADLFDRLG